MEETDKEDVILKIIDKLDSAFIARKSENVQEQIKFLKEALSILDNNVERINAEVLKKFNDQINTYLIEAYNMAVAINLISSENKPLMQNDMNKKKHIKPANEHINIDSDIDYSGKNKVSMNKQNISIKLSSNNSTKKKSNDIESPIMQLSHKSKELLKCSAKENEIESFLELSKNLYGENSVKFIETQIVAAHQFHKLKNVKRKKELLNSAYLKLKEHFGGNDYDFAKENINLCDAYRLFALHTDRQIELLENAIPIMRELYGENSDFINKIIQDLENAELLQAIDLSLTNLDEAKIENTNEMESAIKLSLEINKFTESKKLESPHRDSHELLYVRDSKYNTMKVQYDFAADQVKEAAHYKSDDTIEKLSKQTALFENYYCNEFYKQADEKLQGIQKGKEAKEKYDSAITAAKKIVSMAMTKKITPQDAHRIVRLRTVENWINSLEDALAEIKKHVNKNYFNSDEFREITDALESARDLKSTIEYTNKVLKSVNDNIRIGNPPFFKNIPGMGRGSVIQKENNSDTVSNNLYTQNKFKNFAFFSKKTNFSPLPPREGTAKRKANEWF